MCRDEGRAARIGPTPVEDAQIWPNPGPSLADSAKMWPNLDKAALGSTASGESGPLDNSTMDSTHIGELGPRWIRPRSEMWAGLEQHRPGIGQLWADIGWRAPVHIRIHGRVARDRERPHSAQALASCRSPALEAVPLDQTLAKFDQWWPSANVDHLCLDFDQVQTNLARHRPNLGRNGPSLAWFRPDSAKFVICSTNVAQNRPRLGRILPVSAKVDTQNLPIWALTWPNLARIRPSSGVARSATASGARCSFKFVPEDAGSPDRPLPIDAMLKIVRCCDPPGGQVAPDGA